MDRQYTSPARGSFHRTNEFNGILWPLTIIAVAIVLVVLVFAMLSAALFSPYNSVTGNGHYGSGMMGGGTNSVFAINNTSFNKINALPAGVMVNNRTNTINVTSRNATLVIEAAPTWYPRHGDFWLAYGLVNPNVVISSGTTIHFVFINMDNITHMPAITTVGPPYSYMPTGESMTGYQNSGSDAYPAIGSMLAGTTAQNHDPVYAATNLSTSFSSIGNYWYLCLIPGHAQMGMFGEISVTGA